MNIPGIPQQGNPVAPLVNPSRFPWPDYDCLPADLAEVDWATGNANYEAPLEWLSQRTSEQTRAQGEKKRNCVAEELLCVLCSVRGRRQMSVGYVLMLICMKSGFNLRVWTGQWIPFMMDILPTSNIFRELQVVHETGYFSAQPSLEDRWQQVRTRLCIFCC